MTAAVRKHPQVLWAEELFERLHAGFLDIESTLRTIIASEAWIPLGYRTFGDAWSARMSDITLASELRPHVVYALLNEGTPVEEIVAAVKGISEEVVEALDEQKSQGIPADMAVTTVRRHIRGLPRKHYVTVEINAQQMRKYKKIAKANGMTIAAIALPAIESAFQALA